MLTQVKLQRLQQEYTNAQLEIKQTKQSAAVDIQDLHQLASTKISQLQVQHRTSCAAGGHLAEACHAELIMAALFPIRLPPAQSQAAIIAELFQIQEESSHAMRNIATVDHTLCMSETMLEEQHNEMSCTYRIPYARCESKLLEWHDPDQALQEESTQSMKS